MQHHTPIALQWPVGGYKSHHSQLFRECRASGMLEPRCANDRIPPVTNSARPRCRRRNRRYRCLGARRADRGAGLDDPRRHVETGLYRIAGSSGSRCADWAACAAGQVAFGAGSGRPRGSAAGYGVVRTAGERNTRRAVSRILRPASVRSSTARLTASFQDFARRGVLSGALLMGATLIALVWANSPWSATYFHLWETSVTFGLTSDPVTGSVHHWINDGLMTVFFLLVGLEIKRELLVGELSNLRQALMPIAAAVGGMIVPALIYTV